MDGFVAGLQARAANQSTPSNSTQQFHKLIKQLVLDNSLQARHSAMVTAGFNIGAALVIAISILYDAWRNERKTMSLRPKHKFGFLHFPCQIHPAEIFPLLFSLTITLQGFIFLGVQSTGLQTIFVHNCRAISKILWPSIWIVAYVLLVFGVEVSIRGFHKHRFAARGRWNTLICWVVVVTLLAVTWIPSQVDPARYDKCIASLVWWAAPWSRIAIVINALLILVYVFVAALIAFQLFRTVEVDREERIAASRMVYYLGVGVILMTLVLPFWVSMTMLRPAGNTAQLAAVALNLFGLLNLFLHLLLRSNSDNMALRPIQASRGQRRGWRFFGASDLELGQYIETPVTVERGSSLRRLVTEKHAAPFSPQSHTAETSLDEGVVQISKSLPVAPVPPKPIIAPSSRHSRKRSVYSLFPVNNTDNKRRLSGLHSERKRRASSTYTDNGETNDNDNNNGDGESILAPPRPIFLRGHRRESSEISSATVQIGLRLSNVAMPHEIGTDPYTSSPSSPHFLHPNVARKSSRLNQEIHRHSNKSIELPIQLKTPTPATEQLNPLNTVSTVRQPDQPSWPIRSPDPLPSTTTAFTAAGPSMAAEAENYTSPRVYLPQQSDSTTKRRRVGFRPDGSFLAFRERPNTTHRMKTLPPIPATPRSPPSVTASSPKSQLEEQQQQQHQTIAERRQASSSKAFPSIDGTEQERHSPFSPTLSGRSILLLPNKAYKPPAAGKRWI